MTTGYYKKEKNWFERNPKKTIIIFLLVMFGIILVLTESYLTYSKKDIRTRGINLRYIRLREHRPLGFYRYIPDSKYLRSTDSLLKKVYLLKIDENGFIEPSKIHEKPEISVVFLGGSTTETVFVDQYNRFPYRVGRIIGKEFNMKVNSYNAARSGNNSVHSINILINKIIPMKPDIVVMMHNINDLILLLYEGDYWNNHRTRGLIIDKKGITFELLKNIKRNIINDTIPNTYSLIKNLDVGGYFNRLVSVGKKRLKNDEWTEVRGKSLIVDGEKLVDRFRSSLESFIAICNIWGIKPVLMTQQNRFKDNPDNVILVTMDDIRAIRGINYRILKELFESFNNAIRDVAKENDLLLIDLATEIPQDRQYLYDAVHFNDNGSILAAEIISKSLVEKYYAVNE